MNKITSGASNTQKKGNSHIIFSELIAIAAILLLASAALAQTNRTNSSIVLQDFQVQPQFTQPQLQPLQWLTTIEVSCSECREGENATFFVSIQSLATRPFLLNGIILADTDNIVFGGAQVNSQLAPNQTITFPIPAVVPPATRGRTLYYTPCFSVTDSLGVEAQQSCEQSPRRLMLSGFSVESMAVSIYILMAIVLLAVAVAYFALSSKLGCEDEEEITEEVQSQPQPPQQTL